LSSIQRFQTAQTIIPPRRPTSQYPKAVNDPLTDDTESESGAKYATCLSFKVSCLSSYFMILLNLHCRSPKLVQDSTCDFSVYVLDPPELLSSTPDPSSSPLSSFRVGYQSAWDSCPGRYLVRRLRLHQLLLHLYILPTLYLHPRHLSHIRMLTPICIVPAWVCANATTQLQLSEGGRISAEGYC
jgi:hypothetical protein